ncbi:hypothetical protein BH24ACT3_BH24ACT3_00430 [soil metagenome]
MRAAKARVGVFAVEDTTIQVTWGALPAGHVSIEAAGRVAEIEIDGGPGALELEGLLMATEHETRANGPGLPIGGSMMATRTLAPPPGEELCRVATISDLHLGSDRVGIPPIAESGALGDLPPVRCARAAIAEGLAWGADLLVVKGDVTDHGTADEWALAADLLADLPVPVVVVPGNHDVGDDRPLDTGSLAVVRGTAVRDLPGLRVVAVDTTVPGRHRGRIAPAHDAVLDALAGAPGGALVLLHHQLQDRPYPPLWPPGVPRPDATRFLDAVAAAHPATLVSSGHTHRHRRRRHGLVTVTQVGSTKDYPGTWAGYAVHEGGVRQVVRRVAAPDAIAWSERTRRARFGLWGHWSPGRLDDRCFTVLWP